MIVVDDELKPDVAVTKVKGLLERDKVDFVVGPIFSNVAVAVHKPIVDANTFYISTNAGPRTSPARAAIPYFFATSYQNDQNHEVLGKVAQDRGYKKVYLLAPNYQAGKDALAGFKRHYKGEIVEESYVPLNNLDFQSELAKIASMQPGCDLHLHARRHGREPGQAVPRGGPRRPHPLPVRLHGR